ncbi:MAG: hypothetical protein QOE36_1892 [Gaiellaceae bacterium]|jgi:hypothetical protein|nr:hypothetical protein [Gaiellaceae bacterium]
MDECTKERLALNEDTFRRINDEIQKIADRHGSDGHRYEFFCECSDTECTERVQVTLAEYAHARDDPTRFLVVKGHVVREIEHVVESVRDHVIIEKHGEAGIVAIELDEQSDR